MRRFLPLARILALGAAPGVPGGQSDAVEKGHLLGYTPFEVKVPPVSKWLGLLGVVAGVGGCVALALGWYGGRSRPDAPSPPQLPTGPA
jgi:hypothetical protein